MILMTNLFVLGNFGESYGKPGYEFVIMITIRKKYWSFQVLLYLSKCLQSSLHL